MSRNSSLANLSVLREVFATYSIQAKHRLGQNFLIDDNIVGNILALVRRECKPTASSCEPASLSYERPVLEIGPGIGTLSLALLQHYPVVAVEKDSSLLPILAHTTNEAPHSMHIINGDALKLDAETLQTACNGNLAHMLVANLPYQIAATLILDYFERFTFLNTMIVMVQREVADRIGAQCGSKDYGAYTLKLRLFAQVKDRFEVSHTCFYPQPRVESAVICLTRTKLSAYQLNEQNRLFACKLIDAAFAQRRKTIRNSMSSVFPKKTVDKLLASAHINPGVRAEQLALEDFVSMAAINVNV